MNSQQTKIPGVMLYARSRALLEELEPQTFKKLVLAMLDHVQSGQTPELRGGEERIAWAALADHADADRYRYEEKCRHNRYNRFLREAEKLMAREDCPDLEEWIDLSEQGTRSSADTVALAYDRYCFLRNLPNTNTSPIPTTTPISSASPITASTDQIQAQPQADPRWRGLKPYI